jgi:hypothetical protein
LSKIQRKWVSTCLTGMLLTGTLCWAVFERMNMGTYRIGGLSWMFRNAKMLRASFATGCRAYARQKSRTGCSCSTTPIINVPSQRRAYMGRTRFSTRRRGYYNGQCLMFLPHEQVYVSGRGAILPPRSRTDQKEDQRLKKEGIKKSDRP